MREINNDREGGREGQEGRGRGRKVGGGREGEEGRRDVDISGTIQRHNREQELCTRHYSDHGSAREPELLEHLQSPALPGVTANCEAIPARNCIVILTP